MKRCGNLMPLVADWENLALAYHKASAGRRETRPVQRFATHLDQELNLLVVELAAGSWQPGAYQRFVVRDPKVRIIHAAPFRDRVVHHALMAVAGPCLERSAVPQSYACRVGRGNLAAVQQAARHTRRYRFFLKLDVRRYFDNISHPTLRHLLRRRLKDGPLLKMLDRIIASFHTQAAAGLPIGTLTTSILPTSISTAWTTGFPKFCALLPASDTWMIWCSGTMMRLCWSRGRSRFPIG